MSSRRTLSCADIDSLPRIFMPGLRSSQRRRTLTSIKAASLDPDLPGAAALPWLKAAPSPPGSTAAIHLRLWFKVGHPTAYTPWVTGKSRPRAIRCWIDRRP